MTSRTRGFVLSAFGAYAAVQVGMLRALGRAGVVPDVVVGSSMGGVNAAMLAGRPGAEGLDALHRLWLGLAGHEVPPLNPGVSLRRAIERLPFRPLDGVLRALGVRNHVLTLNPFTLLAAGASRADHLVPNRNLARLLRGHVPIRRLEDAAVPLRILAADVETGGPVALGEGDAVPALLATAATPGLFPGVRIGERTLVDGWVARYTAIDEAIALGAEEVYVLVAGYACGATAPLPRATGATLHAIDLLLEQRLIAALERERPGVAVRVVPPLCPLPAQPYEFHRAELLIERGERATEKWLEHGRPVPGLSREVGGCHGHAHPETPRRERAGRETGRAASGGAG